MFNTESREYNDLKTGERAMETNAYDYEFNLLNHTANVLNRYNSYKFKVFVYTTVFQTFSDHAMITRCNTGSVRSNHK